MPSDDGALAKNDDRHNAVGELLLRAFGPFADAVAVELAKFPSFANENLRRLASVVKFKMGTASADPSKISPRLLKQALDEAAWSEDEIVQEYLGGILVSSTFGHAQDRGVNIAAVIKRLSSVQLRAHYLMYSELVRIVPPCPEYDLRWKANTVAIHAHADLDEFFEGIGLDTTQSAEAKREICSHIVLGLSREQLIDPECWDFSAIPDDPKHPGQTPFISYHPSPLGAELYLWGNGSFTTDQSRLFDPALELVRHASFTSLASTRIASELGTLADSDANVKAQLLAHNIGVAEELAINLANKYPESANGYFYLVIISIINRHQYQMDRNVKSCLDLATKNDVVAGLSSLSHLSTQYPSAASYLLEFAKHLELAAFGDI